jgi:hypothetical protein
MNIAFLTIVLGLNVALMLITPAISQDKNVTSPEISNDTRIIKNYTDRTITLLNTTTNETISIRSLPEPGGNMTNGSDTANLTSNQSLTSEKDTINQSLPTDLGNTTKNLTTAFNTLQDK